jgi:hypothetical protein
MSTDISQKNIASSEKADGKRSLFFDPEDGGKMFVRNVG